MTLKEKFKQWLDTNPRLEIREVQLEQIADDYAVEFADWVSVQCNKEEEQGEYFLLSKGGFYKTKELLKIFKKENGHV